MAHMKKVIFSGMIGNGLEWYDYALYAYMVTTISKLFFPAGDDALNLLATLGIFAVGFIARPFGGVLFGIIGDKFGRRTALVASFLLMAFATGCIGFLAPYEQIGILAPLLLIVLRMLQGLSLGGAFSGTVIFLVEHAPPNKRGLISSVSLVSLVIGVLLGSLVVMLMQVSLSDAQFESWGWRVPFLLGVPFGFVGLYIRNHVEESPIYEEAKQNDALSKTPVREVLAHEWKHVLQTIGIYISVVMPFYLVTAYFITFTENMLGRSRTESLLLNVMVMLNLLVLSPLSAALSDRIGRRKLLMYAAAAFLLLSYPLFSLLLMKDLNSIILGHIFFAVLVSVYTAPVMAVLVEIFPTRVRYTGMALSYNVSAAVFGGTAPLVAQWLINQTGDVHSIAYYVMVCAVISLIALFFYRDRYKEPLQ
jgi:MHS family proline/betaine transporter-like MFS transporter